MTKREAAFESYMEALNDITVCKEIVESLFMDWRDAVREEERQQKKFGKNS